MAKHPTKKSPRQDRIVVNRMTVQIPLLLLSALEGAEVAFFGVCVETGKQVLAARWWSRTGLPCAGPQVGTMRSGEPSARAVRRPRSCSEVVAAGSHMVEVIASGVTMRRYTRSMEPLPAGEVDRPTSRSATSFGVLWP